MKFSIILSFLGLTAASVDASLSKFRGRGRTDGNQKRQSQPYTEYTFQMPIDHFPNKHEYAPHVNGTFSQSYYFDDTYYKPGGPVYLYIGGETSATSRLTNLETGIIQILMSATDGLGVVLENRYYGTSYPFNTSTTDDLRFLSNEQTIADNAYFAQHITFPGVAENLTAPGTPWILYGGSLAGSETAFSIKTYGDILFGGIASSAPIEMSLAYPEWYDPVQKYAPQDCVASINGIVEKIDHLVNTHQTSAIQKLKAIFGLETLADIRDFAMTIAFPIGGPFDYPIDTWQELNWNSTVSGPEFFDFCSNVTNINAPASITEVDWELANFTGGQPWTNLGNYANYIQKVYLPTCVSGDYNTIECFSTQNASYWADTANSAGRSYLYTTCTELGIYQTAPKSYPSLVMNVLQVDYTQQWCEWGFPAGKYNSIPSTPDLSKFNGFGGYNITANRLAFIDGDIDPFLDVCYHSNSAPPRQSSDLHPEYLITGAGHHWDSYGILDIPAEPLFIQQAHLWEIKTVQKWLRSFPKWVPGKN